MNATQLRVRSKIHPDTLEGLKGKVLADDSYDALIVGPTEVRQPDGKPLLKFLPGYLQPDLLESTYETLHSLKELETTNRGLASGTQRVKGFAEGTRTYSESVPSAIIGSFDAKPPKNYCRLTAWSGRELDQFQSLFPLFKEIGKAFAEHVPERFEAQMAFIRKTHPDWVIPGTPFSTITVNNSYPTGVHTDKGDLDEGFSTLAVLRKGNYRGGRLVFPEYRLAVDMGHGDLLLMDAHQWHGNTAMFCEVCGERMGPGGTTGHDERCGTERISVVSYYRTMMTECGSAEEESARAAAWAEKRGLIAEQSNPLIEAMANEATGG
jgi:hypothetical protein